MRENPEFTNSQIHKFTCPSRLITLKNKGIFLYYSQLDLYDKLWFITGHPLILLLLHRYPQERRHKSTSIVILSDFLSLSACVASSLDNTSSCISAWRRVEIKGDSIVSGDWWCENVKMWNCEIVVFSSNVNRVSRMRARARFLYSGKNIFYFIKYKYII